jgi:hypothetical protein
MNRELSKARFGDALAAYFKALETLETVNKRTDPETARRAERTEYLRWKRFSASRKEYREAILEEAGR